MKHKEKFEFKGGSTTELKGREMSVGGQSRGLMIKTVPPTVELVGT